MLGQFLNRIAKRLPTLEKRSCFGLRRPVLIGCWNSPKVCGAPGTDVVGRFSEGGRLEDGDGRLPSLDVFLRRMPLVKLLQRSVVVGNSLGFPLGNLRLQLSTGNGTANGKSRGHDQQNGQGKADQQEQGPQPTTTTSPLSPEESVDEFMKYFSNEEFHKVFLRSIARDD